MPIITQLKESLAKVSETDKGKSILGEEGNLKFIYFKGFKSLKRDLMDSLERRAGDFETKEKYALATALDPRLAIVHVLCWSDAMLSRYFLSSFSNVENGKAARLLLIERVEEYIGKEDIEPEMETPLERFVLYIRGQGCSIRW